MTRQYSFSWINTILYPYFLDDDEKKKNTCGSYFFICFSQVSRYMGWIVGYLCQLAESLKAKKKSLAADSSIFSSK
jgi:hypothetical protein